MAVDIDKVEATRLLNDSYVSCVRVQVASCPIQQAIDLVMGGKNCLTYRYIMLTALVAKAVDPRVDVLSLQAAHMGTELKDKPFTSADVSRAAERAFAAGAGSLLFVAGRQSSFATQPPSYFSRAREKYAHRGMYVGLASIDSLMDVVLASHMDADASTLFEDARRAAEEIGALEAQLWIYRRIAESLPVGLEYGGE